MYRVVSPAYSRIRVRGGTQVRAREISQGKGVRCQRKRPRQVKDGYGLPAQGKDNAARVTANGHCVVKV